MAAGLKENALSKPIILVILLLATIIFWENYNSVDSSKLESSFSIPLTTYSHALFHQSLLEEDTQQYENNENEEKRRRLKRGGRRQRVNNPQEEDSSEDEQQEPTVLSLTPLSSFPSSSSSSWQGTCPSSVPKGNLKVVSDLTKETQHVELITDSHLPQRFKSPPKPVMSNPDKLNPLCNQFAWRFCPNPRRGNEDKNWYSCEARQFVGKIHCAYIDNQHTIPGMVYDNERTYPVHGCHPHQKGFQPQPIKKLVKLDKVAHNLAVYPTGFAHVMAQLPRLIILAQSIPEDVPILLAKSSARDSFVNLLHERGILDKKRIINWDPNTVYYAKTLYYAGEMGRGVGTSGKWDTLKVEYCSWALVMPRERLQRIFIGNYSRGASVSMHDEMSVERSGSHGKKGLHILVVHRKDASGGRRMIKNHNVMMTALKSTFRDAKITEFIGDKYSLSASIAAFTDADVVVAPHGAALGFLAFMRPGTSCVEIGYKDLKGMKFPAPYYMALALSVNVGYFMSMAEGGYGSPLTADVNDVVAVTKLAVAYASNPGAPHPNVY